MTRALVLVVKLLGLVVLHVALLLVGTGLFPVPGAQTLSPAQQQLALGAAVLVAVLDTAVLSLIASRTRLRGWRAYLAFAGVFWGVKTFTSLLEAGWFMPNVTAPMLPAMAGMTLPLCLGYPVALLAAFRLWRRDPTQEPAWRGAELPAGELALKVVVLSALVYPVLFFLFGYFVAYASPAVREFYGDTTQAGLVSHLRALFARDPWVWPFEALRGLLWIALALPVLRTVRGPAWLPPVLVGLLFCVVQNDVHLMPNPLMPREVGLVHLVETGSSNFLWALAIGWLLGRSHARPREDRTARPSFGPWGLTRQ